MTSAEAARLLGVSPTSIKRWADSGALQCARTQGGHRRFHRAAVERARVLVAGEEVDFVQRWLERLASSDPGPVDAALLAERARRSSWWRLADALGPVLDALGEAWARGAISIAEEHLATMRLARALDFLSHALPCAPPSVSAVLAPTEEEEHTIGLMLAELCLREMAVSTIWLGRATPTTELVRILEKLAPDVVVVSASVCRDASALVASADLLGARCHEAGAALVLGGRGPWPANPAHGVVLRTFAELHGWAEHFGRRRMEIR